MMDRTRVFDVIYAYAALDGRDEALFGTCYALAREAFCRSLPGEAFPELWFEVPLLGKPWFDLHALTSRYTLEPGMTFTPDATGGCPEVFEWFAQAESVRQLALSYDVSSGDIDHPAVQLLLARRDMSAACEFLEAAGRGDIISAYRSFVGSLPDGWFACYSGTFPRRTDVSLRVECIPTVEQQRAYAEDGSLLESHLRQVGFTNFGGELIERCQVLARAPFRLEFQFNVRPDGRAEDTLGASVRFAQPSGSEEYRSFEYAGGLLRQVQDWGLADGRWPLLGQTAFAKRIRAGDEEKVVFCFPTFLKLRWRSGEPLDAKAYLMAGVENEWLGGGR